jgi:hypothetical protein
MDIGKQKRVIIVEKERVDPGSDSRQPDRVIERHAESAERPA